MSHVVCLMPFTDQQKPLSNIYCKDKDNKHNTSEATSTNWFYVTFTFAVGDLSHPALRPIQSGPMSIGARLILTEICEEILILILY